jgi:hypothetical protein
VRTKAFLHDHDGDKARLKKKPLYVARHYIPGRRTLRTHERCAVFSMTPGHSNESTLTLRNVHTCAVLEVYWTNKLMKAAVSKSIRMSLRDTIRVCIDKLSKNIVLGNAKIFIK